MAIRTKTCLTCGKMMTPVAQFCPRCGSAFLRISGALPGKSIPAADQAVPLAPTASAEPTPRLRPNWELLPVEFARPWPWYVGRVIRRAWGLILACW